MVVVGEHKEFFKGEKLTVESTAALHEATALECLLTVKDNKQAIASFKEWSYWRETE